MNCGKINKNLKQTKQQTETSHKNKLCLETLLGNA